MFRIPDMEKQETKRGGHQGDENNHGHVTPLSMENGDRQHQGDQHDPGDHQHLHLN